jgi:group II intron reverse transcriptase/maturase
MGDARSAATTVSTKLQRIAELARQMPGTALTNLSHHIDVEWLAEAFRRTRKDGATGVDGTTAAQYAANLEGNLRSLLERAKSGTYRAPPVRRVHIPKGTGNETRPLGIPTFEDKVLQRAVAMALEAVYEQDFKPCSFGFRPGRSAHQALESLWRAAMDMTGGWVIEVDIRKYFDSIDHARLREILRQRVRDGVLSRLIGKWLHAGVMEEGSLSYPDAGTPQGGVISPLLANVYLHYVFDLWAERWRRREATGDMILMRYADDIVVGFEHEADARRFWDDMRKRFEEFSLSLNPEKTRLIEFGRFAAERRAHRGLGKPETFNFLGFTFICERNSRGQFLVKRTTRRDRMRATLKRIKDELRQRMHQPIPEQGAWLKQVVRGFFAYHAVPTNGAAVRAFYYYVKRIWLRTLRRRSQKDRFSWQRMHRLAAAWLPQPRILHPYPDKRFAVMHPRWEPCAGIPPARIWAGGGQ